MNCHQDGAARLAVLPRAAAVELPPAVPAQLGCGTQQQDALTVQSQHLPLSCQHSYLEHADATSDRRKDDEPQVKLCRPAVNLQLHPGRRGLHQPELDMKWQLLSAMHFNRISSVSLFCSGGKQVFEVFSWDKNSLKSSAFRQKWVRFSTSFFSSLSRDLHLELLNSPTKTHSPVISKGDRHIQEENYFLSELLQTAVLELAARSTSHSLKIIVPVCSEFPAL